MKFRPGLAVLVLLILSFVHSYALDNMKRLNITRVAIFENDAVHFSPDDSDKNLREDYISEDNGRVIKTKKDIPSFDNPVLIYAELKLIPVPKDDRNVYDPWDRAGSIRLHIDGQDDIEIVKFMTAYGGETIHDVDVTYLAPVLKGECTFVAFIDTWVSPAWKVDFKLRFEEVKENIDSDWVQGVYFTNDFNQQDMPDGVEVEVNIPEGTQRVVMNYFTSGHCTDGRDGDEFLSKANVIYVDDVVVERFYPWRDDCWENRAINPYCKRWTEGAWSSDFSRSGWCPGKEVPPVEIDLSDHLLPGKHIIKFVVEDMRRKGEDGHYGYWRISSHLVGWNEKPQIWKNWGWE